MPDDFEADPGSDDDDLADDQGAPGPRSWMPGWLRLPASLTAGKGAGSDAAAPPEDDLSGKSNDMRDPEPLYGYVVALELIAVSILNLTVTHGKGAPTHPSTTWSLVGLLASIALVGIIRTTHHRLIVAFSCVIAAFFVTLPRVPDSLTVIHLLALIIPVVYAFYLSQRQRKAAAARLRAGRSRPASEAKGESGRRSRRGRREKEAPSGPQANRRYTPPKAKRARR
jgi:hypothetical protein